MTWVADALNGAGGEASIVDVAKSIWASKETELKRSGNLFFTWQYDMRWAAKRLRDKGILAGADATPRGIWALKRA
jgi:hypothetical protein